jgi:uncharacterized protein YaiE (UPF0345 family)
MASVSATRSSCRRHQEVGGVILPSTLTFNTGVPEIMEGVAGAAVFV